MPRVNLLPLVVEYRQVLLVVGRLSLHWLLLPVVAQWMLEVFALRLTAALFHVASGALEFFKDHRVHHRAGIDQGGGENGQRTAFFDVARGTEELLGTYQGGRFDTTRHDTAGIRCFGIVGTRQTGDRVEQDDDILRPVRPARLALLMAISAAWT